MHKCLSLFILLISLITFAKEPLVLPYEATEKYVVEDVTYYKMKNGNWIYVDKEGKLQNKSDPTIHPRGWEYYKVNGKYLFRFQPQPNGKIKHFFKDEEIKNSDLACEGREDVCSRVSIKFENGIERARELYDLTESNPSETTADAPFKPDPKNVKIRFQGEILPGPEDAVEYGYMWDAAGIELLHRRGKRYYQSNKKLQEFLKKLDKCIVKKGKECEYMLFQNNDHKNFFNGKIIKKTIEFIRNPEKFLTFNYNYGIGFIEKDSQFNCFLETLSDSWKLDCNDEMVLIHNYGKPYKDSADPR